MTVHSTGIQLVAAFVVFLVGAGFWLVREFEQPLAIMLRAVHARRRRWFWIHMWMFAGVIVSIIAIASLGRELRGDGGGQFASPGVIAFTIGCVSFLLSIIVRLTALPRAAAETVRTNEVSRTAENWNRIAGALYAIHMLLSYAAFALLGGAMLRGAVYPVWLGWTGVVLGLVSAAGFALMRGGPFAPPILAHLFGLIVGIVALVRSLPPLFS